MTQTQALKKAIALSKKSRIAQALSAPMQVGKYYLLTRYTQNLNVSIKREATLFTGDKMLGLIPDPAFSYIYLYGFSEEGLSTIVSKHLKKGMCFLDVGAHMGYYSIIGSRLVGKKGKVYSFEPTPTTYQYLSSNVSSLGNVIVAPFAAWSKNTILDFFDYGPLWGSCNSYTEGRLTQKSLQEIKPTKLKVQAISIDNYCEFLNIKPDFIKIDVESAEYEVLKGMKNILKKYKPIVALEIGDKPGQRNGTKMVMKYMENSGYSAYEYKNGKIVDHKKRRSYLSVYENILFLKSK